MKKRYILRSVLFLAVLFLVQVVAAQQVNGVVTDEQNNPLANVVVEVQQTHSGTYTDADGRFSIQAELGAKLLFTYYGESKEEEVRDFSPLNVVMKGSVNVGEVIVLGSRAGARSALNSLVPVDAFNMEDLSQNLGQGNLSRMLNAAIPSLSSITHSGMNITDFVDAPTLRGMSPAQTLVLINGKRLHPSSLMNVTGGTSNGSVGTDLNTIPAFALRKIEVLRDGLLHSMGPMP